MNKFYFSLSLFLAVLLVGTPESYADSWYKRRKCNAFYKRYKTKAQTWIASVFRLYSDEEIDKDKGCTKADSYVKWNRPDAYRYTRAYARVGTFVDENGPFRVEYMNYGEARAIEEDQSPDYHDKAGYAPIHRPSIYSYAPMIKPHASTKEESISDVYIKSTADHEYDYDNHRIIIHSTEGHLMVNPYDVANKFTALTVSLTHEPASYIASDDPVVEEAEYVKNVFWSSKAILN